MYTILVTLIVLASILMILIVLIQESKGGGLSANFSSSNNILGVRRTNSLVENVTWGLAIAMVVLSIASTWVAPQSTANQSVLEKESTTTNTATPGFGTSAPAAGQKGAQQSQGAQPAAQGTNAASQGEGQTPANAAPQGTGAQAPVAPTPTQAPAK